MTAEIAILNKSAVALATDSAVTISAGDSQEKIFDSADKLFELCLDNPIGVMIYNTMDYMGTPLAVLVKDFRSRCESFETVREAAIAFLEYLQEDGAEAPQDTKDQVLRSAIEPLFSALQREAHRALFARINDQDVPKEIASWMNEKIRELLKPKMERLKKVNGAKFVGTTSSKIKLTKSAKDVVATLMDEAFDGLDKESEALLLEYAVQYIRKSVFSPSRTGIVVAGFGSSEKFPSLVWFETDGLLCGHLKFREATSIDIDRSGTRAAVVPFAQKDMIERFLYGLDAGIANGVKSFCEAAVPQISLSLLEKIEFDPPESKDDLEAQAKEAERAFLKQLNESAFEKIRQSSRVEIEDMVEFMPKPEMARMAEALIDLTSIKRRVTRGMETVGGPVDVAVISRSEGFVWVKRKHYFDTELNARYETRLQNHMNNGSNGNG